MTVNQEVQTQPGSVNSETAELNFRKQQAMYQKQLESERNARLEAERKAEELQKQVSLRAIPLDDDYSDEPYVDQKFLNKKLANFEKTMDQRIEERAEQKARALLEEERRDQYLQRNNDFNQVMSPDNVQRLAETHPELAKSILSMPDGFERQKLVYHQIKTLGLDRPKMKEPSIQEKIDANRRSPYYQPTGSPSAPYSNGGDFSSSGQKNAYNQMQELKNRMRL